MNNVNIPPRTLELLPSTYRRAANFNVSSSRMTGIDILNTANHSSHVRGQI